MGSSAYAKIAWGIDFGDPENTMEGFDWEETGTDSYDFENKVMPVLFAFTEEPPALPADWAEMTATGRAAWRETCRVPWEQRRDAAIPLTFESYGYEFGGKALVLKRSLTTAEWSADAIDLATIAAPTEAELSAFNTVMNKLEHDGGQVKLLLMAMYG